MGKVGKPISQERARWLAAHVLPHEPALRAWLKTKSSLNFDADDVIQETYAILAAKVSLEGIVNPRAYMFQVAYSVILQQFRQSRVVPINAAAEIGEIEMAADAPSPEDTVLARDELLRVQRAIDALPRQTRIAFILRRVEGLSQREIAARMNLSEHTIEKHIARGIKSLLAQFGRGGNHAAAASNKKLQTLEGGEANSNRKIH